MATLAILNPVAGRRAALRVWRRIRAAVPETRDWECMVSQRSGHASGLARVAATDARYARVVAIGGDGTASEVANGLADSPVALALIPAGTANDFASSLSIPHDPVAAARLALTGAPRPIDLGELRTGQSMRLFLNVAGFGFDAEAAWRVNRLPRLVGGTLPYLVATLQTLWQYASPHVRVSIDGQTINAPLFMVAVANCASYGGGMRIVPPARPDDGVFDVCVVKDVSRLHVLRLIPRLYSGAHVFDPAVELFRGRRLEAEVLSAGRAVLCHADGEPADALPARFAIRPGALRCVPGPPPR